MDVRVGPEKRWAPKNWCFWTVVLEKTLESPLVCKEIKPVNYKGNQYSVQFSRSVVSNSLQPHELQHTRPPCPLPTPRVHPNSCASSRWCHLAISSSVVPFSLETLNILWKDWCWSWSSNTWYEAEVPIPNMKSRVIKKDSDGGKDWRQEEKGMTEDEILGWHHPPSGNGFEKSLGDGKEQGSLACCSPWGHKESDMTEWLNNNKWQKPTQYWKQLSSS